MSAIAAGPNPIEGRLLVVKTTQRRTKTSCIDHDPHVGGYHAPKVETGESRKGEVDNRQHLEAIPYIAKSQPEQALE